MSAANMLRLPRTVREAYTTELQRRGLLEKARHPPAQDGPTGGITLEQTNAHFAERFSGSCGRLELATIDPKDELGDTSNILIKAFSGGKIAILDAPCGAGAATAALLGTIAHLRSENRLPTLPLDVVILGGDISAPARQIAEEVLETMRPGLEREGVFPTAKWVIWDALDANGTSELLDHWITNTMDSQLHLLVLANFSAFLHKEKQFDRANPQLQEMIRWTSLRPSSIVLWVEPPTSSAADFFKNVAHKVISTLRRLVLWRSSAKAQQAHASTSCKMEHAFEPGGQFRTGVHLIVLNQNTEKT